MILCMSTICFYYSITYRTLFDSFLGSKNVAHKIELAVIRMEFNYNDLNRAIFLFAFFISNSAA